MEYKKIKEITFNDTWGVAEDSRLIDSCDDDFSPELKCIMLRSIIFGTDYIHFKYCPLFKKDCDDSSIPRIEQHLEINGVYKKRYDFNHICNIMNKLISSLSSDVNLSYNHVPQFVVKYDDGEIKMFYFIRYNKHVTAGMKRGYTTLDRFDSIDMFTTERPEFEIKEIEELLRYACTFMSKRFVHFIEDNDHRFHAHLFSDSVLRCKYIYPNGK